MELGSLNTHVASCEFNPVPCSNDQCDEIISRRDKEVHESKVCDFRPVKCDYCSETVVYKNLMQHTCPQRREIREMKEEMTALKRQVNNQDKMFKLMRSSLDEMREMMQTMMSKIEGITTLSQCSQSETGPVSSSIHNLRAEIIVAWGRDDKSSCRSVQMFNMATKTWRLLSDMNESRTGASSVVYQGHMIVTGGLFDLQDSLDSVEELNLAQQDGHWIKSQFKLPLQLQGHVCVVYRNRLLVTGGCIWHHFDLPACYSIYEIVLNPPYTSKLLTSMPRGVKSHGVEVVNNKIYIIGGRVSGWRRTINSVLMFDPETNHFTELQPLPYAVSRMATVSWKDNVVVLGGISHQYQVLDTVILYNVTTGSHRMLPSMKRKRYGCTAVIIDDNIVVMGGYGDDSEALNSVECYNFDTNTWTEFPAMINAREFATAVVKYC